MNRKLNELGRNHMKERPNKFSKIAYEEVQSKNFKQVYVVHLHFQAET